MFWLFGCICLAQENGIVNYAPKTLKKLSPQNWCVATDSIGEVFIGNNKNLIHFDGEHFNEIKIKDTRIEALLNHKGTIYIGGDNSFGYLQKQNNGRFMFFSLSDSLKDLKAISSIVAFNNTIVFKHYKHLYLYSLNTQTLVDHNTKHWVKHLFNGPKQPIAYLQDIHTLSFLNADHSFTHFYDVPQDYFVSDVIYDKAFIYVLLDHHFILQFSHKGKLIKKIRCGAKLENAIFRDFLLFNKRFYISSSSGLYITDLDFNLLKHISEDDGLRDNNISSLHIDSKQILWLTLSNGLSKLNLNQGLSPLPTKGLSGLIEDVSGSTKNPIVATHAGCYTKQHKRFTSVKGEGIRNQNWDVLSFSYQNQSFLFTVSNSGVHQILPNGEGKRILKHPGVYRLFQSPLHPNCLYVGLDTGLIALRFQNGHWQNQGLIVKTDFTVYTIDYYDGFLWLGADLNGQLMRLHLKETPTSTQVISQTLYGPKEGLPEGMVLPMQGYFGTDKGIYLQEPSGKFSPHVEYNALLPSKSPYVHRLSQDPMGNLWAVVQWIDSLEETPTEKQQVGYFHKGPSGWSWVSGPFAGLSQSKIDAIHHPDSFTTYLGGTDGLYSYNIKERAKITTSFHTSLTTIESIATGKKIDYLTKDNTLLSPTLDYEHNGLRLHFSGRDHSANDILYRYYLEGFEHTFSAFAPQNFATYKNLTEGTYTFHLEAQNAYGIISKAESFSFTLNPPWYRTWWAYLLYVALIAIIAFSIFWIWTSNLRHQVKAKTKEVVAQKDIIQLKNKEMLESIEYAERIQKSILPSRAFLKQHFKDGFVIFKPRDIVSGDFYWVQKKGHLLFFSVMDCTGHGVPGAFMSMIGNRGLNEIVLDKNFNDPGLILTALREYIVGALSQDGTSPNRDGMDGSLCVLNTNTNLLSYASAYNDMYLIRANTSSVVIEKTPIPPHKTSTQNINIYPLKAQKMPIGYYPEKDEPFVTQTLELLKGDRVYLSTDGYPDQFGGEKGKKYKRVRFLKLLALHQTKHMNEQRALIWQEMLGHMGTAYEQTDDICVLGIEM